MSDTELKTKEDYLRDVASQLKEMRHYAENNTETLSAHWLAFDAGDYKDQPLATRFNDLLNLQGKLHKEIESVIQDIEIQINQAEQDA
ncbi:hypothetical protein [Pantoea sp. 1.19]|uniref:hypothetical protein n=1 Tax=Pantoea sp. 1.19 TaxID=1925589 RepID=UPI000948932F|nr:hypothetical protein [Pantoea sp. 1.19]